MHAYAHVRVSARKSTDVTARKHDHTCAHTHMHALVGPHSHACMHAWKTLFSMYLFVVYFKHVRRLWLSLLPQSRPTDHQSQFKINVKLPEWGASLRMHLAVSCR